ncbi:unnamed protein product, partial [Mesorhabditis belari]|uniref:RING-type domain-containing protein n=1 Tax=Mesorhabditis belari TaxID=2138241 RepID=A0AAF3EZS1_9BILA
MSTLKPLEFAFETLCCPVCATTYSTQPESSNYPLMLSCGFPMCSFCFGREQEKVMGTEEENDGNEMIDFIHTQQCPQPPIQCFETSQSATIVTDLIADLMEFSLIGAPGAKPTANDLTSLICPDCLCSFDSESMGPSMPQILECAHAVCGDCMMRKKFQKKTKSYPFFVYEYKCTKCGQSSPSNGPAKAQKRNFLTEFLLELSGPRTRNVSECSQGTTTTGSSIQSDDRAIAFHRTPSFTQFTDGLDTQMISPFSSHHSLPLPRTSSKLKSMKKMITPQMEDFYRKLERQKEMDQVLSKQKKRQMAEFIELQNWREQQQREKNELKREERKMKEQRQRVREEMKAIGEEWNQIGEERRMLERERKWMHDQKAKAEQQRQKLSAMLSIHEEQQEKLHQLIIEQHHLVEERLKNLEIKKKQLQDSESLVDQLEKLSCKGSMESLSQSILQDLPDSPPFGLPLELWTNFDVASWGRGVTESDLVGRILVREKVDGATLTCISLQEIKDDLKIPLGDAKKLWTAKEKLEMKKMEQSIEIKAEMTDELLVIDQMEQKTSNGPINWCRNSLRKSLMRKKKANS